ncbi:MAG: lipid II:glycine glycyltransferase FemX, partial [Anaerolineales bacterium]
RERRAIVLKVEPDRWAEPEPSSDQPPLAAYRGETPPNFVPGTHDIQPPRTIVLDIRGEEDQILARMKQKTRYNIRLALRKGVVVRSSNNLDTFDALIQTTGRRGDFGVHSIEYYRKAYELFYPREACELLVAEYEHEPLATVMIFGHGSRAWYFYGASSNQHRNYMPTYLLQWEGIRWARAQGCTEYDLWGVPDADHETLEAKFTNRRDGLWGVYRFKRGFGGQLRRAAGSWDRVYNPLLYKLYCWWTP